MRAAGAMPDSLCIHAMAHPTAALIFDDTVYVAEALGLPVTKNEDDVDAELALHAAETGIQHPYLFLSPPQYLSRALSTMTTDSDHRSSGSIHSQETESTSFTSAPSRTSRDQLYPKNPWTQARRAPPETKRASLSVVTHGQTSHHATPRVMPAHPVSTPSAMASALSSASSLQSQSPRRKRASNLFSLFRKNPSSSSSQAHDSDHSRSRSAKLGCEHALPSSAARIPIQEAPKDAQQAGSDGCGAAIPCNAMEGVLAEQNVECVATGHGLHSPDVGFLSSPASSDNETSSMDLPRSLKGNSCLISVPRAPNAQPRRARHQEISVEYSVANEAFTTFRVQQKEQFEQIAMFECSQRKALSAYHQHSLERQAAQHMAVRVGRMEQHAQDLERLEERQISAEHDLRQTHEQETQNVATALKHMEAYCLSTNATHPEHPHIVTQEDFKKLDQQRLIQQNLPRRHQNAINVLRARQERDMKHRVEKQALELDALIATQEQEKITNRATYKIELDRLDALIDARRKRILQRWDLRFEMWRRDWEKTHHTSLTLKLEHEEWPPRKAQHVLCIPDSSALAPYAYMGLLEQDLSASQSTAKHMKRMTL